MKRLNFFFRKIIRPGALWAVISGVLTAVSVMYARIGLLAWISLIPYLIALYQDADPSKKKHHLFRTGFLFGFSYYLLLFSFFISLYPTMESLGLSSRDSVLVILLADLGLAAIYSLPHGLLPCVLLLLRRRGRGQRGTLTEPFAVAALWVLVEWVQSQTWLGMPWGQLAVSQYRLTPLIQSASLLGSCFVSFLIILFNVLLARFLWQLLTQKNMAGRRVCLICAAALFLGNLLYGIIALNMQREPDDTISVAIVQGNLSSSEKWGENGELLSLMKYLNMTQELSDEEIDLIIWTEGCVPVTLNQYPSVSGRIQELAAECGATILVGSYYMNGTDLYNSVYIFYPDGTVGEQPYCKRRLVPFGEYMPRSAFLEAIVPALAELNLMSSQFTSGSGSNVFTADFGTIGALVCFDSVYETPALQSVRDGAEILALLSNDAWYDSSFGVFELLGHSVLRAVENGRSIVRGANTGISAVIDAQGRIQTESNLRTDEVIRSEASLYSYRTLYSLVGNILVPGCLIYVLALLLLPCRNLSRRYEHTLSSKDIR